MLAEAQATEFGMLAYYSFVQSNHFRDDLEQYDNSMSHSFPTATNSVIEIVTEALNLLKKVFRKGIRYKRAGVMVSGICSAEAIQPDLFYYNAEQSQNSVMYQRLLMR